MSDPVSWEHVAGWGFSAWAAVLPVTAAIVVRHIGKLVDKLDAYILATEHRITKLEEKMNSLQQKE